MWWLVVAGLIIAGGVGIFVFLRSRAQPPAAKLPLPSATSAQPITALGYIEPEQELIQVASPSAGFRSIVTQLKVKAGDKVQAGQVIAVLSSRDSNQAAVLTAQAQVNTARAQLDQVKAGAKTGAIQAQAALVTQAEAELKNSQVNFQRYQALYETGAVSAAERDSRQVQSEADQAQRDQARQTLQSIAEVRPVDVQVAEVQLATALAQLDKAKADLELSYIHAPRAGQIIRINTYPGELIGDDGVVELGQTSRMYVSADVYQNDIQKIQIGQPVLITGDAFNGELSGTVREIGWEVRGQSVEKSDPLADVDARVVQVKIRLQDDSSQKVSRLTNLQVQVVIKP
ncbi:MAG: efflux RND transporter periplasmic adaptor subunit [Anaerolineae bacterium]|nr:efflux RND transporter periplasmic adaptor subunit [Gloeobacterales cyanobacterium ES-bin-313]